MSDDKVVYLKGSAPAAPSDDDAESRTALRGVFRDAMKDLRAGKFRAAVIVTLEESDAVMWRIGGSFSTGDVVAALEVTKIHMMMED
jgi:riboflavin synthase alpha subunit